MKIIDKNNKKKLKNKKKPLEQSKKEHVLLVAQEIKFARLLSGNEKKTRDRAVKSLKKWLSNCFQKNYQFKEDDFARLWKGLFYAVWMSDKPLVQEELCEGIASILDHFPAEQLQPALRMVRAGFKTLATEWYGIDQHRMDKFLMLVRRYLRGGLRVLARSNWSEHSCKLYAKMMSSDDGILAVKTPLYARNATSMILHVIDCFLEEVAKVSEGEIPPSSLAALLRPFVEYICGGESPAVCTASRRVLTALVRQSEPGLRYWHQTNAWKRMGCPKGGPDALELVSDDDDDGGDDEQDSDDGDGSEEKPLDPRAGRVDVVLPTLLVPAALIADMFRQRLPHTASKARTRATICMERFEQLAKDEYPLRIAEPDVVDAGPTVPARQAANSLMALEKKLIAASDELALRGLSRKHRKRLLAKSRAGMSIIEDLPTKNGVSNESTTCDWKIEEESQPKKKKSKDSSNKENVQKNKKRKLDKTVENTAKKQKLDETQKLSKENKKRTKRDNKKKSEVPKESVAKVNSVKNAPAIIKESNIKKEEKKLNGQPEKPKIVKNKREGIESVPKTVNKKTEEKLIKAPTVVAKKIKKFQKKLSPKNEKSSENTRDLHTPKKVKFVLKKNSMQGPVDYYKSVKQSPNIPFDSSKKPSKTNLKPSTPSPINPFFKKKLRVKN